MAGRKILVLGGAGFIGCNTASYFASQGDRVIVFDNFYRKGSQVNARWLKERHGKKIEIIKGDIRTDFEKMKSLMADTELVLHFAAQVAVTCSVENPRNDFEINALGTFNALEALRQSDSNAVFIYSSTNKVYGGMEEVKIIEENNRYQYKDFPQGIPEVRPLDFHSPYGCSKGCGDQYSIDFARIYGLNSIVLRKSCIYGPRQFGLEDQGWLAWFAIAGLLGKPLTIYGDGKQIRDVLFISDLVKAYELAHQNIKKARGKAFNIGGGSQNTLSLLELISLLEEIYGKKIDYSFSDWRPGDQKVYVSDISKAKEILGWQPAVSVEEGVRKLCAWVKANKKLFKSFYGDSA